MNNSNRSSTRGNRFTEFEVRQLEANQNVQHVSEKNITYTPSFKLAAVQAYDLAASVVNRQSMFPAQKMRMIMQIEMA